MSAELQQLLGDARAAYRRGHLPEAKELLLESLEQGSQLAYTYYLLSNISLRQDDPATAEQHGRRAVELDGANPNSYRVLVKALERSGGAPAALDEFRRGAGNEPGNFAAAYGLSLLLLAAGRNQEIEESLDLTRKLAPDTQDARWRMARLYFSAKRYRGALRLLERLRAAGKDSAKLHGMAGKCLLELKKPEKAAAAFERALRHTKAELDYHVGLSVARAQSGRLDDARRVTTECLERFTGATFAAKNPEARILVISSLGLGFFGKLLSGPQNFIPGYVIGQIPFRRFTMHYIYINHPDPVAAARSLGPIDLIYNNVANAELAEKNGFTAKLRETIDALGVPVVNAPEAVARTTRLRNAETLPKAADIIFPRTCRYSLTEGGLPDVEKAIAQAFSFPLILRRTHTNFDRKLELVTDEAGLGRSLRMFLAGGVDAVYAIDYITEESRPGIYRKIRCALIGGKLYPVNMEFSNYWNVHRSIGDIEKDRVMQDNPEFMDQELQFLRDAEGWLGEENTRRLMDVERAVGLDFVGVDFNVLSTGELVVFEVNPAMNILQKKFIPYLPYFADFWEQNLIAFEEMLLRRAGK